MKLNIAIGTFVVVLNVTTTIGLRIPIMFQRMIRSEVGEDHHPGINGSQATVGYTKSTATRSGLNADDFLIMPQMMMNMGRLTKGMPVEYRPVPMIAGTRKELEQLVREVNLPLDLHQYIKANMSESDIIVLPMKGDEIATLPASRLKPMAGRPRDDKLTSTRLAESRDDNNNNNSNNTNNNDNTNSNKVTLSELLPLLRTDPIPSLLYDEPALVLTMLRSLAGPKPDGSKAADEPLDQAKLQNHIQSLVRLATNNPKLIRTMAKFDPDLIPHIVNIIFGIDKEEVEEEQPKEDGENEAKE